MYRYSNIAIVLSFFCLWINSYLIPNYQILLGFLLIFSFGILHGANDLVIIKKLNNSKNSISFVKILSYYTAIIGFGILLFFLFPLIALLLFVIFSGYHFGEQQLQFLNTMKNSTFKVVAQFVYGIFILFLLFNFNQLEVQKIVQDITFMKVPLLFVTVSLKITAAALLGIFTYIYLQDKNLRYSIRLEICYLVVFTIIFLSSSLIWGFAIFFVIWHSVPSMLDQINFLHGRATFYTFLNYFKSAFLYWLISLIGITMLYFVFKDEKIFNALFFSFLAAITFPHVLVIIKMFEKKV